METTKTKITSNYVANLILNYGKKPRTPHAPFIIGSYIYIYIKLVHEQEIDIVNFVYSRAWDHEIYEDLIKKDSRICYKRRYKRWFVTYDGEWIEHELEEIYDENSEASIEISLSDDLMYGFIVSKELKWIDALFLTKEKGIQHIFELDEFGSDGNFDPKKNANGC